MCRNLNEYIISRFDGYCFSFRLIEQTDLIGRDLLAAGGVTFGQCEVQLLLESKNLCLVTLVFGGQLLVASNLISEQRL